jgi:hypothetical protein
MPPLAAHQVAAHRVQVVSASPTPLHVAHLTRSLVEQGVLVDASSVSRRYFALDQRATTFVMGGV